MELRGKDWLRFIQEIDQFSDSEKYIFAFDVIQSFKEHDCYKAHDFCLRRACYNGSETPVAHLCSEDLLYLQRKDGEYPLFDYVLNQSLQKHLNPKRSKSSMGFFERKQSPLPITIKSSEIN